MAGGRRARLAVAAVLVLAAMLSIALRASAAADAAGDSVDRARFEEALSASVRHAGFCSRSDERRRPFRRALPGPRGRSPGS